MDAEIRRYVESVASEILTNYTINVEGVASKDGYQGDIIFVAIHGTNENQRKKIGIAVKVSKILSFNTEKHSVENLFKQETFFYDEVFPAFECIQKDFENKFKPYPYCFKSFSYRYGLILENLRTNGYQMLDKDIPMDFKHCKAVMEVFGKFHALSFVLKNHNREKFDRLSDFSRDLSRKNSESWEDVAGSRYQKAMQEALNMLKEKGDVLLSEEMGKVVATWKDKFCGYQDGGDPQAVLTHGDCWNNNMMFRYDLADVRTPVYDICLFLYSSCSDFKNFDQLIKIYYSSLATFLEDLSVSLEVFTFEDLRTHLTKYTPFMIIHLPFLLKFMFNDGTLNVKEGDDEFAIGIPLLKKDLYYNRLKQAFQYYYITYFDLIFHRTGPLIGQPRGYAFVTYKDSENANEAKSALNNILVGQKHILVAWAHSVNTEEVDKTKAEISIPALAMSKQSKKLDRNTQIQAIEAKLKLMENNKGEELKINDTVATKPPVIVQYQYNKNQNVSNSSMKSRYGLRRSDRHIKPYVKHKSRR
nr:unnamed protein product [Callosobruchus chinensis]